MERGQVGPWRQGAELARSLSPLPIGGGAG
jgi:hypothetical protein